jgi:hypothetical protein
MRRLGPLVCVIPLLMVCAVPGLAGEGDPFDAVLAAEGDTYGTEDGNDHWLAPADFMVLNGAQICATSLTGVWLWNCETLTVPWIAHLRLPAGASIAGYRVYYFDGDPSEDITVTLLQYSYDRSVHDDGGYAIVGPSFESSGTPGYGAAWVNFNPRHTYTTRSGSVDFFYQVTVAMPAGSSVRFRGVRVEWYRQVSPEPASATFSDVPVGYWAFQHVEALAASGITAGCGGGNFCPEQPLTRAQKAVFLAKGLGLHFPGRDN